MSGPDLLPLPPHADVVVVGTGFSGLGAAHGLLEAGHRDLVLLERSDEVGGTWRDNSYPGCACDIPSNLYSFSWALKPDWSHVYGRQEEIWRYQQDVAERFGIRPHVRFRAGLEGADWDASACLWRLRTARGAMTARVLVSGCGPLAEPAWPDLPGLQDFQGPLFHSAQWQHDADLTGRVAVIGTGASAIQFVPHLSRTASQLTVFQRTAPYVAPRGDRAVPEWRKRLYRAAPVAQRAVRSWSYWFREYTLRSFRGNARMRALGTRQVLAHLEAQVPDPELRAKLVPDYELGCKRVLVSDDYYPALSRPGVEVVTEKVLELRPNAVVTADGVEHEVDAVVLGTGFRVTDNPSWGLFRGTGGRTLLEVFEDDGPQAHRGTTVAGFPNLFLLVGPNTGLGHNSIVYMIEAQVAYLVAALEQMRRQHVPALDVRPEAQSAWNARVQHDMAGTVWSTGGCASWYLDRRGRNTTLWPGFTFAFRRLLSRFDSDAYAAVVPLEGVAQATPAMT